MVHRGTIPPPARRGGPVARGPGPLAFGALLLVALFLLPGPMAPHPATPGSPAVTPVPRSVPSAVPAGAPVSAPARPGSPAGVPTIEVYGNNSSFATVPLSREVCAVITSGSSAATRYCSASDQNPSAAVLANGAVGVAFSRQTSSTSNVCRNASRDTSIRIGWAESSNGGASFGAVTDLGNDTCAFEQATEPSFGVTGDGTVVGAYVQYNATNASTFLGQKLWTPPWNLGWRKNSTLGFVQSTTNGTSWSSPVTLGLVGAYVARPSLATSGRSVYIAYDSISSTNVVLTGASQTPKNNPAVAVRLIYSTDDGATWHGPYLLPGMNASEYNHSMSPAVAVASNGTVAVAYLTNRSCNPAPCKASPTALFQEDLVVATSRTNGSTWSAPHLAAGALVEDQCYGGVAQSSFYNIPCYRYLFDFSPTLALAYQGPRLVVAYASYRTDPATYLQYTGTYAGFSSNGGVTWNLSTLVELDNLDEFYGPSLAVSRAGSVYLSYTWENESACPGNPCSPMYQSFSQWIASTAPNGTTWSTPGLVHLDHLPGTLSASGGDWLGWSSSTVVVPSSQTPTTFFPIAAGYTDTVVSNSKGTFTWTNYSWQSNLSAAFPYTGATTTVNFTASGLAANSRWGVSLDGQAFRTNTTSLTVGGIPVGVPVLLGILTPSAGGWAKISASAGTTGFLPKFSAPTTVPINFTEKFGFAISFHPSLNCQPYYFYLQLNIGGSTYTYSCGSTYSANPGFPWYLPAGQVTRLNPTTSSKTYWNTWFGSGNGSYTGSGLDANLTVNGPINESVWGAGYGYGNVSFQPLGLPPGSIVQFSVGSHRYQGPASAPIVVTNISTGAWPIANISANSSRPGWEYFGSASCGGTLEVPLVQQVNLTFATVEVGSPLGNVSFTASGIGAGTPWQLSVNGTRYAGTGPTKVLALRNGSYPFAVGTAIAANGSVGYVPVVPSGFVNVTVGSPVAVPFQYTYRVQAAAGLGGTVLGPAVSWIAPGGYAVFNASASSGYAFAGWTGNGSGSYTGPSPGINVTVVGPIVETAQFFALPTARFNATFTAQGLGDGALWTVFVGGVGYATNLSTLVVPNLLSCTAGSAGTYNLSVPYSYEGTNGTRYVPSGYPSHFCTTGSYARTITYTAQFLLSVAATAGGLAIAGASTGVTNRSIWVPFNVAPSITAQPEGNNSFLYWNGTGSGAYTGGNPSVQLALSGPVSELAVFVPPLPRTTPTYTLTLLAAGLPSNTPWGAVVGGNAYAAVGPTLNVTGLANGTYTLSVPAAYSADGLSRYDGSGVPASVDVKARTTQGITFVTSFWVSVSGSLGGSVSPSGGGWYLRAKTLTLVARPDAAHLFVGWTGNATGVGAIAYSGTNATPPGFKVLGPIVEYASFGAPAPAAAATENPFTTPAALAGFGVVGVAIGLLVGIVVARRRGAGPPVAPSEGAAPPSGEDPAEPGPDAYGPEGLTYEEPGGAPPDAEEPS